MSYGVEIRGSSDDFANGVIPTFTIFNGEMLLKKIIELSFPRSSGRTALVLLVRNVIAEKLFRGCRDADWAEVCV